MLMPYLPHETMHDILVRLPVKTLLRFKAVCKLWFGLISDPQFANSQLHLANKKDEEDINSDRHRLLQIVRTPSPSIALISLTDHHPSVVQFKKLLRNPFQKQENHGEACDVRLLGSCNGLLFVRVASGDNFLWNPLTGKNNKLSSSSDYSSILDYGSSSLQISGLGYDNNNDDYKAIIAFRTNRLGSFPKFGVPEEIAVSVCSSKSGGFCIKYFHDFPYAIFKCHTNTPGVTVNGAPHWVVSRKNEHNLYMDNSIICFDMVEESFKKVSPPESYTMLSNIYVAALGGLLCVLDKDYCCNGVNVWVMKEYGVKESWTKLFLVHGLDMYLHHPMGFTNGKFITHGCGDKLKIYDLQKGKEEEDYTYPVQCGGGAITMVKYVESLVSPDDDHGHVGRMTSSTEKSILCGYKRKRKLFMTSNFDTSFCLNAFSDQ